MRCLRTSPRHVRPDRILHSGVSMPWPFPDLPNVVTMVSRYIQEGEPITYAYREWADGFARTRFSDKSWRSQS